LKGGWPDIAAAGRAHQGGFQGGIRSRRTRDFFYVNFRPVVYELFEQLLASGLIEELKQN